MYHPNVIFLGDCNLDFKNPISSKKKVDAFLKKRNSADLRGKSAKLNFPFLSVHPDQNSVFRTNARISETYDQIGIVAHDKRLPTSDDNKSAGSGQDAYDFGMFNYVELFCQALHKKAYNDLTKIQRKTIISKFEHDFSDHMPIWIRLPKP